MSLTQDQHDQILQMMQNALEDKVKHEVVPAPGASLGSYCLYEKRLVEQNGKESKALLATLNVDKAGGTMRQDPRAPKDLTMLKTGAFALCVALRKVNPTGHYKLAFTGPDAEAIKAYVETKLGEINLTDKFILEVGRTQPVRPSALASSASSAASAASASSGGSEGGSQRGGADEQEPSVVNPTGF